MNNEDGTLPRVTDVRAETDGADVTFQWDDPGLATGDGYHVRVDNGTPAVQRAAEFAVVAEPGQRVCIVVRVTREGRVGPPSAEKCIQMDGA
jgi:eukaryotic-like serine/threonine-protein kinase